MWNIFVRFCWGIVSAAPPLRTEQHACFALLRENDYYLEEKSRFEQQNCLRCTQTAGFWCNMCVYEIISTESNLVEVLITCSGKTAKREKKIVPVFPWEIPFLAPTPRILCLSKHSVLGCSGKNSTDHFYLLLF